MNRTEAAVTALQAIAAESAADPDNDITWTGLAAVLTFEDEDDDGPQTVLFLQERINGVTYWGSTDGTTSWTEDEFAAIMAAQ